MSKGKLIIFSAPSGSGKTTIIKQIKDKIDNLSFSISATNRAPREGEINNKDYYFITTDDFKAKVANNEFVEWEEVYEGRFYGTLKSEVERIRQTGNHVLFDIDVKGGINIKKLYQSDAVSIFIMPPSITELRNRLVGRNTDSVKDIEQRIKKAEWEISFADKFDYTIVNDDLQTAVNEAITKIQQFIS